MTARPATGTVRADDGAALWTAVSGTGPPMVLCHGGPGAFDTLGPLAALIDDLTEVTRWDQRACGRSGGTGPLTIERFVADMEAIRHDRGADRWVVGGHSWGANLALCYAQRHPERVRGLLYVCGTGLAWWDGHVATYYQERLRRWTPAQAERVGELMGRSRTSAEERELRGLQVLAELAAPDERLAAAIAAEEVAYPVNLEANAVLNDEQRAIRHADAVAATGRVRAPALIVHGARDPRPASATDSLLDALPRGRREVLAGAGHYPWLEAPDAFRAVVSDWLRAV